MSINTRKWCVSTTVVAVIALGVAGCSTKPQQDPSPVVSQDNFVERFNATCEDQELIPLSSLTAVNWDRAYLFPEGTSGEKYKAETGSEPINWSASGTRTPPESLLVLQQDGAVIEAIQLNPATVIGNREQPRFSYSADVLIKMTQTEFGCFGELIPSPLTN